MTHLSGWRNTHAAASAVGCRAVSWLVCVALLCHCSASVEGVHPDVISHGQFSHLRIYRPPGPTRQLALLLSGDGGWGTDLDSIAQRLALRGSLVAGIDVREWLAVLANSPRELHRSGGLSGGSRAPAAAAVPPAGGRPDSHRPFRGGDARLRRARPGAARGVCRGPYSVLLRGPGSAPAAVPGRVPARNAHTLRGAPAAGRRIAGPLDRAPWDPGSGVPGGAGTRLRSGRTRGALPATARGRPFL